MSSPRGIISRLTPSGAGAVAVVRVQGPMSLFDDAPSLFLAANGRPVADQQINRVCYGEWGTETPESIVLCRTNPEETEIQCHGGQAAVARIMDDLETRGCVVSDAVSTRRDTESLIEAECREAVIHATTLRTADVLLQQQEVLPQAVGKLAGLSPDRAKRQVEEWLVWAEFGVHLTEPWRVVLCGRPNVGKSSLINALVGFSRSIVFDQPGTTRDVVAVETALDGWPIEFSDTAGIRADADDLESVGIERARQRLADADLRIVLIDVSQQPTDDDRELLAVWGEGIVVAHKCDLDDAWRNSMPQAAMAVSSVTGAGVEELAEEIVRRLVPCVPPSMTPMPVTRRQTRALLSVRDTIDGGVETNEVERRISAVVEG